VQQLAEHDERPAGEQTREQQEERQQAAVEDPRLLSDADEGRLDEERQDGEQEPQADEDQADDDLKPRPQAGEPVRGTAVPRRTQSQRYARGFTCRPFTWIS
jgi:hypothetical protein